HEEGALAALDPSVRLNQLRDILVWPDPADKGHYRCGGRQVQPGPGLLVRDVVRIDAPVVAVRDAVTGNSRQARETAQDGRLSGLAQVEIAVQQGNERLPKQVLEPGIKPLVRAKVVDRPDEPGAPDPGQSHRG